MSPKKASKKAEEQADRGRGSSAEGAISALLTVSRAITSEKYLEDILGLIVTVTAEVMESKICSLMLIDDDGKLHVKATQSMSKEYNKKRLVELGKGIVGKVASENRPAIVRDVREEEEYIYRDMARKEGLVSLLSVPLAVKGRVIGVINCYTSRPHDFTEAEVTVVTTIASRGHRCHHDRQPGRRRHREHGAARPEPGHRGGTRVAQAHRAGQGYPGDRKRNGRRGSLPENPADEHEHAPPHAPDRRGDHHLPGRRRGVLTQALPGVPFGRGRAVTRRRSRSASG